MSPLLPPIVHLALALWVGALFAFATMVAPMVFKLLPSRAEAGALNGAILSRIEAVGLVLGGITLLGTALWAAGAAWAMPLALAPALAAVMVVLTLTNATAGRARLAAVRRALGEARLEELPATDPRRVAHRKAHGWSVRLFGLTLLLGLVLIVLLAVSR